MKKLTYKTKNWQDYNQALINRGRINLWIDETALENWLAPKKRGKKRGRPLFYSDECIAALLSLRYMYKMPLRLLQGFSENLLELMNISLPVPHYSVFSRRASCLKLRSLDLKKKGPLHLVIFCYRFKDLW